MYVCICTYIHLCMHTHKLVGFSQWQNQFSWYFQLGSKTELPGSFKQIGEISRQVLQARDLYIWDISLIVLEALAVSKAIESQKCFQSIAVQDFTIV